MAFVPILFARTQNANRRANCITRGSPARLVMLPAAALLKFIFGRLRILVFVRLNISQRNWRLVASAILKSYRIHRPKTFVLRPRRILRPALPNWPGACN